MQRTSVQRVCLAFGIVFVTDEVAEDINDSLVDALLPDPWGGASPLASPILWAKLRQVNALPGCQTPPN
jgi:hypothetical protein